MAGSARLKDHWAEQRLFARRVLAAVVVMLLLVTALGARLYMHVRGSGCRAFMAPFDVLLPESPGQEEDEVDTVVQPDVSVICDPGRITPRGCRGAPDLAIEILSPYTAAKDMRVKRDLYERHGVREYWIVDIGNRCVHAYRLADDRSYGEAETLVGSATLRSSVCPGFELGLAELFADA